MRAIRRFARRMRADERAFLTYYAWQVFVRTPDGVRQLTGPGRQRYEPKPWHRWQGAAQPGQHRMADPKTEELRLEQIQRERLEREQVGESSSPRRSGRTGGAPTAPRT